MSIERVQISPLASVERWEEAVQRSTEAIPAGYLLAHIYGGRIDVSAAREVRMRLFDCDEGY